MARKGKLGSLVAINGAYGHDLRDILANSVKNHHYRLQEYIDRTEEETLSSYPLTIMNETVDMSSLMESFAGAHADKDDEEVKKDKKK